MKQREIKQGDVYMVNLSNDSIDHETGKVRPCVIVSCNKRNDNSSNIFIFPITHAHKKRQPCHYKLYKKDYDLGDVVNVVNEYGISANAQIIEIFESDIFEVVDKVSSESPCYLCARMRRGFLYSKAKELGCNKIALGHHFDDVIETILLNMFYASEIKTMMPKLHSTNFKGMELIRPMYLVKEEDILAWRDYHELEFLQCACRFTEKISEAEDGIGESR